MPKQPIHKLTTDEPTPSRTREAAPDLDAAAIATRIRLARRRSDFTLDKLASETELDKSYLSRVERGLKTPSISTLHRIAAALGIPMSQLFGEATAPDAILVIRRDQHTDFPSAEGDIPFELILPADNKRRLSAFLVTPPREALAESADHPGDELLYVLTGAVEVIFADRTIQLEAGDCVHFDGHLKHRIRRAGKQPARLLLVIADDLQSSR